MSTTELEPQLAALEEKQTRMFPIQPQRGAPPHPLWIHWEVAELAYSNYAARFGRSQSLEELARRGGFCPYEMDDQLPGWREIEAARGDLERENAELKSQLATDKERLNYAEGIIRERESQILRLTEEARELRAWSTGLPPADKALLAIINQQDHNGIDHERFALLVYGTHWTSDGDRTESACWYDTLTLYDVPEVEDIWAWCDVGLTVDENDNVIMPLSVMRDILARSERTPEARHD